MIRSHAAYPQEPRHKAARELRKEFGPEVVRIILGHRAAAITEIYAEKDEQKAIEAIGRAGRRENDARSPQSGESRGWQGWPSRPS